MRQLRRGEQQFKTELFAKENIRESQGKQIAENVYHLSSALWVKKNPTLSRTVNLSEAFDAVNLTTNLTSD